MKKTLTVQEFKEKWKENIGWEIKRGKKEILESEKGPLWVVAGPGTGKTEALILKTLKLLLVDRVDPDSIFLTTFTEKGAEELEDRIANAVQDFGFENRVDISNLRTGTLHSLCDEIMREYRYPDYVDLDLLDQEDQEFFVKRHADIVDWIKDNEYVYEFFRPLNPRISKDYGPTTWQATQMSIEILNRARQYLVDPKKLAKSEEKVLTELSEKLESYQDLLDEEYRTDFAELQKHFLRFLDSEFSDPFIQGDDELETGSLEYILVDEYQDTNPLQEAIYFKLAKRCNGNIVVVGDDDQALYRFRGGSVECMVRFGEKCKKHIGKKPERIQLKNNFRSHPDIVEWINRYIGDNRDLNDDARAGEKEDLISSSDIKGDYPAVSAIFGSSRKDSAERMADFIEFLNDKDVIEDYSQIALLLRSTRESPRNAEKFINALKDKNIPVYNPRNKSLTEQDEIKLALGCLISLIDREPKLKDKDHIRGRFLDTVEEWIEKFEEFRQTPEGKELDEYVKKSHEKLDEAGKKEKLPLVNDDQTDGFETIEDIFYRILSREPFSKWKEEDPNKAKRLAILTNLLESYSNVYPGSLRTSGHYKGHFSHSWLRSLYYNFIQYIANSGFDEPEDPYEQIPDGYLQVMTVHQAKGLEFPVVFSGDINKRDNPGGSHFMEEIFSEYSNLNLEFTVEERAAHDNIRRFYVQYSRAEHQLILVGSETSVKQIALGYDENNPVSREWFEKRDSLIDSKKDFEKYTKINSRYDEKDGLRRRYSVTGDILSYRRCARQYGHFSDYGFSPAQEAQMYFGKVIHNTLDRIHQQFKSQIQDGEKDINEIIDEIDDSIDSYFNEVSESLKARGIYPMSDRAEKKAREYIKDFNEKKGKELYPRVKDTEHHLQTRNEDFVMEGTVDVLVRPSEPEENPSNWEIWDYKAAKVPDKNDTDMKNYRYQMQVYAGLFELKNGTLPSKAVLYFLAEDDPEKAEVEINFDRQQINKAIETFSETVGNIELSRKKESWPAPPSDSRPSDETCDACDLRWDCPAVEGKYTLRTP